MLKRLLKHGASIITELNRFPDLNSFLFRETCAFHYAHNFPISKTNFHAQAHVETMPPRYEHSRMNLRRCAQVK